MRFYKAHIKFRPTYLMLKISISIRKIYPECNSILREIYVYTNATALYVWRDGVGGREERQIPGTSCDTYVSTNPQLIWP